MVRIHHLPPQTGSQRLPVCGGAYKKADEIVVVNPSFIPPLVELGIPRENVTYIPNFVDHEKFHLLSEEERNKVRDKYGVPHDKFVVLGCGQVQTNILSGLRFATSI